MAHRRDNGTGSVYQDKARGRWVGEVVLDGHKRRVMARTKVDASAKLRELIRDHEAGTVAIDGAATVATATKLWRDRVLAGRELADSTAEVYRWASAYIDAELGTVRLRALDVDKIEAALDRLAAGRQGRPLGQRSLKTVRSTLAQVLDTAMRRKLIATNPARIAELTPSAAKPTKRTALDPDGARRLWDALAADGSTIAACFQLQLVTGMRPGEVAGVCWDAVDFDTARLTVRRAVRQDHRGHIDLVDELKNASSFRTIGLSAPAIEVLRAQRVRNAEMKLAATTWDEHNLCFPGPTGRPLDPSKRRKVLADICRSVGLPKLTSNEMRHTAATVMSDRGVPLELIADVLGHVDTRMLDATYRHRVRPSADAAVATMNTLFGS